MKLGPHTRRFAQALLKMIAVLRQSLAALARYPDMRERLAALAEQPINTVEEGKAILEGMEGVKLESHGVRAFAEDHLEAAGQQWREAQAKALAAWERGEERMPVRWMLRKVGELQQLEGRLAELLTGRASR